LSAEIVNKQDVIIYPNPSDGVFTLKSELIDKKYSITDAQGRLIQSGKIENNITHIKLDKEKGGIYYLRVEDIVLKMVKQ
jgi:hypothetical protein